MALSGRDAKDRAAVVEQWRQAYRREQKARQQLAEAQRRSGAALAVARMARAPWADLGDAASLSKQSMVERLARFAKQQATEGTKIGETAGGVEAAISDGLGTRFALPEYLRHSSPTAGGKDEDVDADSPASDPDVKRNIESAARFVMLTVREQARERGDSDEQALEAQIVARARALEAGEAAAVEAAERGMPAAEIPVFAARAAASTAPHAVDGE